MSDSVNRVVEDLRALSERLRDLMPPGSRPKVYFPPKGRHAVQPVTLRGEVPVRKVAALLHYVADMLEE